jgi:hypothetical protein
MIQIGNSRLNQSVEGGSGLARDLRERGRKFVETGSRVTGIENVAFAQLTVGVIGLALLLLVTLGSWYDWILEGLAAGEPISRHDWWRGISYTEGKWIFMFALAAGAWLVIGIVRRSWLRGGTLAAGGVGIFSAIAMLVLWHRMARDFYAGKAEIDQVREQIEGNVFAKYASESTNTMIPEVSGGPSWLLALGIMLSIGIALVFLVLSLRDPPRISLFHKPDFPPLIQKHGVVAAGYVAALLFGLVFAAMCYA